MMKIKLGELRRLIREVSLSPSLLQNNKIVEDPFDNKNLVKAFGDVQRYFKSTLEMNLTLAAMKKHYNSETREMDDSVWSEIKSHVEDVTDGMSEDVVTAIKIAWQEGNKTLKGGQDETQSKAA